MDPESKELDRRIAALVAEKLAISTASAASQLASDTAAAAHLLAEATRVDLAYIKRDLDEIKGRLDNKFVTMESFDPIKRLVYGQVALVLTSIVLAGLTLLLK